MLNMPNCKNLAKVCEQTGLPFSLAYQQEMTHTSSISGHQQQIQTSFHAEDAMPHPERRKMDLNYALFCALGNA